MSAIRKQYNPIITGLLRQHDLLPLDNTQERNRIKRQILFFMTTVKMAELAF
jgi:hypothetical protein